MSYRVETASSGRAGCKGTECKKHKIKIDKDELRLGVWVDTEKFQSWSWKHWGCVTGKQIENIRAKIEVNGEYDFDLLDGFDSPNEKYSLNHHPDLQEKVRRAITQGFIDPEDFNGDPEKNVLGATGMHTAATKKKQRKDQIERNEEIDGLNARVASLEPEKKGDVKTEAKSAKKGKRVKAEADSDEEETKPVKKKRAGKVKKEEEDDQEEVATKPAKKSRAKKAVKNEDDEMDELAGSPTPIASMTVAQLKALLKEKGLPVTGNKAVLIQRLEESSLPTPPKKESGAVKQESSVDYDESATEAPASRVKNEPSEIAADMGHLPAKVEALGISEANSAVAEHGSDQQEPKQEHSNQVATSLKPTTGGRRRSTRRTASGINVD